MNIPDLVVGKPIKTSGERAEQIGPTLIPLGLQGVRYIIPISAVLITLLVIVYFPIARPSLPTMSPVMGRRSGSIC